MRHLAAVMIAWGRLASFRVCHCWLPVWLPRFGRLAHRRGDWAACSAWLAEALRPGLGVGYARQVTVASSMSSGAVQPVIAARIRPRVKSLIIVDVVESMSQIPMGSEGSARSVASGKAAPLVLVILHRFAMWTGTASPPRPIQRERIDNRTSPGLHVIGVIKPRSTVSL